MAEFPFTHLFSHFPRWYKEGVYHFMFIQIPFDGGIRIEREEDMEAVGLYGGIREDRSGMVHRSWHPPRLLCQLPDRGFFRSLARLDDAAGKFKAGAVGTVPKLSNHEKLGSLASPDERNDDSPVPRVEDGEEAFSSFGTQAQLLEYREHAALVYFLPRNSLPRESSRTVACHHCGLLGSIVSRHDMRIKVARCLTMR